MLFFTASYAKFDVCVKTGVAPWQYMHEYDGLSKPISLSFSGALHAEYVFGESPLALMGGVEYNFAGPGTRYIDLTDREDSDAMLFDRLINEYFVGRERHTIAFPLMLQLYTGNIRLGAGVSWNTYYYDEIGAVQDRWQDFGYRGALGLRLSKRIAFEVSYYYGMEKFIELPTAYIEPLNSTTKLSANVQFFQIMLALSLFNNISGDRYYMQQF